jgi:hypothetical protein
MKTLYVMISYFVSKREIDLRRRGLKRFNVMPKSIKKAIRYIYQDAPTEQLVDIQQLINQAIEKRLKESKRI